MLSSKKINAKQNKSFFSDLFQFEYFSNLSNQYALILKNRTYSRARRRINYKILFSVSALVVIGLIVSISLNVINFETRGELSQFKQIISIIISFIMLIIFYKLPLNLIIKSAPYFIILPMALIFLILLPGIGREINGATRWVNLPFFSFQPSEALKLATIIFLSGLVAKANDLKQDIKLKYLLVLLILCIVPILIFQSDLGTTLTISIINLVMIFKSGVSYKKIGLIVSVGTFLAVIGILSTSYRRERFLSFINYHKQSESASSKNSDAYHLENALIGIGSGGLFGKGIGKGIQSFGYVPEVQTDSVFAGYAEKLGFIGSIILLGLYAILLKELYRLSLNSNNIFSSTVLIGIFSWIAANTFVNLGSILGLIPFTGVPLPFISLGGSSLIMLMAAVGLSLNIANISQATP
jgi:cell division protein FtsW